MTRNQYTVCTRASVIAAILLLSAVGRLQAQTYTLAPAPYQTVLNTSGAIVPAGCVWTYSAGTTTPIATYLDTSGTLNGNPIIADSSGRFVAYLLPGTNYKFVYELTPCNATPLHGTVLKTQDNIQGAPASSANVDIVGTAGESLTAGQCAYLSDGSGSKTVGQWYRCDSTNPYSSTLPAIGLPIAAIASATTGTFRISGYLTGLSSLTASAPYYASTAGALTATAPTNNPRRIGWADTTTTLIVNPNPRTAPENLTDCNGRLTLTTGTAVTTSDVTAATTLFFTPYKGNRCALYDGTFWTVRTFAEVSIAVPATTSTMYDVWLFDNAGTIALELLAWTNDTTRATALVLQDGVYAKTGALTRRYLGSFRTTTVSGQTEDSATKRHVWNFYNRVPRQLFRQETSATWTYTTATTRQANANTANQFGIVQGVIEAPIELTLVTNPANSATGALLQVGIGEDSTVSFATSSTPGTFTTAIANGTVCMVASVRRVATAGYHFYSWNEFSTAVGTTTWVGTTSSAFLGIVWG